MYGLFRFCSELHAEQPAAMLFPMIFLDDSSGTWLTAPTRRQILDALLAHLPDEPNDEQLAALAAACLGCEPLDVRVIEE